MVQCLLYAKHFIQLINGKMVSRKAVSTKTISSYMLLEIHLKMKRCTMYEHERIEKRYIRQMLIIQISQIHIRKINFKLKLSLGIQKVVTYNKRNTLSEYIIIMNLNATSNITIVCIEQKFIRVIKINWQIHNQREIF